MAGNRLTHAAVQQLNKAAGSHRFAALRSLNLSRNCLGWQGGCLLSTFLKTAKMPLEELDVSDNNIGDQACEEICTVLGIHHLFLVGLSLAKNNLGDSSRAGVAIESLVSTASKLQALDLHWNRLHGAGAAALMQGLYENACSIQGQLWRVNLAWNRLGQRCQASQSQVNHDRASCTCEACRACSRTVLALARVLSEGTVLFHLDLSYNGFCSAHCAALGEALRHNHTLFGLHVTGNEASIDDVGFIVPHSGTERPATTWRDVRKEMNESLRNTPAVLRLQKVCSITGQARAGPAPEKAREVALAALPKNPAQRSVMRLDAFSPREVEAEKEWVDVHSKVQDPLNFGEYLACDDVHADGHCCWICENWVQQLVSYVPGWSGPETSSDEVQRVFAFFSTDGFLRPTRLARTTEPYVERDFKKEPSQPGKAKAARKHRLHQDVGDDLVHAFTGGDSRKPFVDEQGRYVVFRGSRMLPPTSMPVKIVFQVGDAVRASDHLPKTTLPKPLSVKVHEDGRTPQGRLPDVPAIAEPVKVVQFQECNVFCVHTGAWQRFEQGMASALCIMEDPRLRGDIEVVPRKLQYINAPAPPVPRQVWQYEASLFREYKRENDDVYASCFEHDYAASKLEKFVGRIVKDRSHAIPLRDALRNEYHRIMAAFYSRAFRGFSLAQQSPGLGLMAFSDIFSTRAEALEPAGAKAASKQSLGLPQESGVPKLAKRGTFFPSSKQSSRDSYPSAASGSGSPLSTERKRRAPLPTAAKAASSLADGRVARDGPVFGGQFTTAWADTICIGSNVVDRDNPIVKDMRALPAMGLARFQFLEAFVRIALARFMPQTGGSAGGSAAGAGAIAAVKELLQVLNLGEDFLYLRTTLQKALFCEECCMVIEQNMTLLEEVMDHYGKRMRFAGRHGSRILTYGGWLEFLEGCNAPEFGLEHNNYGVAFALGRELRVDEFKNFRHMELNLVEFFVCIGAAVRLSGDFDQDFFPDRLQEFVEQHVTKAMEAVRSSANRQQSTTDPAITKLVEFLANVFEEADVDGSGSLTRQEFNHVLLKDGVMQGFKEMGVSPEDFKVLFTRLDADRSGTVTLEELCEGMLGMKRAMGSNERTIAYLCKVFKEADRDNSGTLTCDEFKDLFLSQPSVRTKLQALGVPAEDVDELWEVIDAQDTDGTDGVSCEEMVAGFLSLKQDTGMVAKGLHYLRQVFKAADTSGDGRLSRSEMDKAFYAEAVQQKLSDLGLMVPDWLGIFDAIDFDCDGTLTWAELSHGVGQIWSEYESMRKLVTEVRAVPEEAEPPALE